MSDAVKATGARISIVFVPAKFFLGAATECAKTTIGALQESGFENFVPLIQHSF